MLKPRNLLLISLILLIGVVAFSLFAFAYTDEEQQQFINAVSSWEIPNSDLCSKYIVCGDVNYNFEKIGDDFVYMGSEVVQFYLYRYSDEVSFEQRVESDGSGRWYLTTGTSGFYCIRWVSILDFLQGSATSWINTNSSFIWDSEFSGSISTPMCDGYKGTVLYDYDKYVLCSNVPLFGKDGESVYTPYEVKVYNPSNNEVILNENKDNIKFVFKAKGAEKVRICINDTWLPKDTNSFIDLSSFEYDANTKLYGVSLKSLQNTYGVNLLKTNSINKVGVKGFATQDGYLMDIGVDYARFEIRDDPFKAYVSIVSPEGRSYNNDSLPDLIINSNLIHHIDIFLNEKPFKTGLSCDSTGSFLHTFKANVIPYIKNSVNNVLVKGFDSENNCIVQVYRDFTIDVSAPIGSGDIYTPPDVLDDYSRPVKPPSGSSLVDYILYYVQEVVYLLTFPFRIIGQALEAIIDVLSDAFSQISQLVGLFGNFISFMPREWVFLVTLGLTLGLVLRLFGR